MHKAIPASKLFNNKYNYSDIKLKFQARSLERNVTAACTATSIYFAVNFDLWDTLSSYIPSCASVHAEHGLRRSLSCRPAGPLVTTGQFVTCQI